MEGKRQPLEAPYADTGDRTLAAADSRSIRDLLRTFGIESGQLVREEMRLARAEMNEKVTIYKRNLTKVIIGGGLIGAAGLILLAAVNRGLTVLLSLIVAPAIAVWMAPLILAVVLGVTGRVLVQRAQSSLKEEGVAPRRTVESLRADKNWAHDQIQEMRNA